MCASYFRGVKHPDFPSVLDTLNCSSPVITNCLIDMRGIECILVIKVSHESLCIHSTNIHNPSEIDGWQDKREPSYNVLQGGHYCEITPDRVMQVPNTCGGSPLTCKSADWLWHHSGFTCLQCVILATVFIKKY